MKNLQKLGKVLNRAEQQKIKGSGGPGCTPDVHYSQCDVSQPGTTFYNYGILPPILLSLFGLMLTWSQLSYESANYLSIFLYICKH